MATGFLTCGGGPAPLGHRTGSSAPVFPRLPLAKRLRHQVRARRSQHRTDASARNSRGEIPRHRRRRDERHAEPAARCRILTRMAYPKNLIQDGETVALDLRPHWWYFSRNILTGIPLLIIVIVVLANVDTDGTLGKGTYWVVALVFLAWAAWLVLKYFQWVMTYFVVTSRRVHLPHRGAVEEGRRDPARAHQQHQLPPADHRPHHRRRRSRHRVGRARRPEPLRLRASPDGVQHEIYRQMETRNMPQNFPAPAAAAPAAAPVGSRCRSRRPRACPIRSSSSRTCATRATSRPRSTSRRRPSSSAVCDRGRSLRYPTGSGTASISVSHGRPAFLRSSHLASDRRVGLAELLGRGADALGDRARACSRSKL